MDSLVLRWRYYAPKLGREVTLRLVGLAADRPNYVWEETGERMNSTRVLKVMGFDPTRVAIPPEARPVPLGELPPEIRAIRYCRWCGRWLYRSPCPYDGKPAGPVSIYRIV